MKICSVCHRCFEESETNCFDPGHGDLKDGAHSVGIVPSYLIERVVAFTPRAAIYQGRQIEYGKECLISIAEGDTKQFLGDAAVAAGLFHAGVAGVIESGQLPCGSAFAVSEGFAGESLRNILAENSLSLLDRIVIARQAAEAIQAIHLTGLLHGALSPENVSIEGLGTDSLSVKLHNIDLGTVFGNNVLSNRFAMDAALGPLRYFAPERFRGETAVQSDVYSLGILLYELLAGHPPFEAETATALIDMHLHQRPPEAAIENFDLRMLLTHTISESLQKQPSFRQATADLFAREMRHIEQLATHVSTPPPAVAVAAAPSSLNRPVTVHHAPVEPQPAPAQAAPMAPRPVESTTAVPKAEVIPAAASTSAGDFIQATRPVTSTKARAAMEDMSAPRLFDPTIAPVAGSVEPVPAPVEPPVAASPIRILEIDKTSPIAYVPTTPKRSRLKAIKKRLHANVPAVVTETDPPTPTLIEWQQPEGDIPSMSDVRGELAKAEEAFAAVAIETGEEDITAVRPPVDRIQINWEESGDTAGSVFSADGGALAMPGVRSVQADDRMFGGYHLTGRDVTKVSVYAAAFFGVLIVSLGFYAFVSVFAEQDGGYIGEYHPASTQAATVSAQAQSEPIHTESTEPAAMVSVMNIPAEQIEIPALPAQIEEKGKSKELKDARSSDPAKQSPSTSAPVPVRAGTTARTIDPIVPSTLVISRAAGKPKVVVVSNAPPFGSRRLAEEQRARAAATRPRIVTSPN